MLGLHGLDWAILIIYICIVAYLGLFLGARKTHSLGDFFIAGGRWGKLPAFLFNFSSALAGAEAVVVSAAAYRSGLSGIWLWWSQLLATPMYYLFSVVYKRARVFNMAEFFELRFGPGVATLYSFWDCSSRSTSSGSSSPEEERSWRPPPLSRWTRPC